VTSLPPSGGTPVQSLVQAAYHAAWFRSGVRTRGTSLWRGVEAQHIIATMKLVDNAAEQLLLEELLEASKPAAPAASHYLIFTPFRYRPSHPSRFRPAKSPGLWYGAEELETACAEVGYWKWRFLMDSAALAEAALHTQHTFFQAEVAGRCVNLTARPWNESAERWQHGSDYSACHQLAAAAREHQVAWIRYASARKVKGICAAVLTPDCLSLKPGFPQQTWACKTTRGAVFLQHGGTTYNFDATGWI
jgi:hypothetical protein